MSGFPRIDNTWFHHARWLLAIALCLAGFAPVVSGPPIYPHPAEYSTHDPWEVALADLDDDGIVDLVMVTEDDPAVWVYPGSADGLLPGTGYAIQGSAGFLELGDFNEDGFEDLAVTTSANGAPEGLNILLGGGDATFGPHTLYECDGCGYWDVVVGDFDDDVHQDILVTGTQSHVYLGDGSGGFSRLAGSVVGAKFELTVAADFDGDDQDDYATGDDDSIDIQLGLGDGSFAAADPLSLSGCAGQIVATRLDAGDSVDLVVADKCTEAVALFFGNGDGTFGPRVEHPIGPMNLSNRLSVGDLNGDGQDDIAVGTVFPHSSGNSLAVLLGTGGGQFAPVVAEQQPAINAYGLASGDLDGNGTHDLFRGCNWCWMVVWDPVNEDGTLTDSLKKEVGDGPQQLAVGDLDGDGRVDIVTTNEDSDDLSVLLANGAASFLPEQRSCIAGTLPTCDPVSPRSLAVGELTGDAYDDVVAGNSSGVVTVLESDALGALSIVSELSISGIAITLAVGDVDGDAANDLVVIDAGADPGAVLGRVAVFLGADDGTFEAVPVQGFPTLVGYYAVSIELALLDGDEHPDAVVTNAGSGSVSVLLGQGDGHFTHAPTIAAGTQPNDVAVADVVGGPEADLVVTHARVVPSTTGDIRIYEGNGDGTFGSPTILQPWPAELDWPSPSRVQIVDVDLDGHVDLATQISGSTAVIFGDGAGSFENRLSYYAYTQVLADFDLNRRVDLAGAYGTHRVSISLNRSGPAALSFAADGETLVWPAVEGVQSYDVYRGDFFDLADVDEDGLADAGYGDCRTALDDDARDTFFVDSDVPGSGGGFFYLTSAIDAMGESGLGESSSGLPRLPATPCP